MITTLVGVAFALAAVLALMELFLGLMHLVIVAVAAAGAWIYTVIGGRVEERRMERAMRPPRLPRPRRGADVIVCNVLVAVMLGAAALYYVDLMRMPAAQGVARACGLFALALVPGAACNVVRAPARWLRIAYMMAVIVYVMFGATLYVDVLGPDGLRDFCARRAAPMAEDDQIFTDPVVDEDGREIGDREMERKR